MILAQVILYWIAVGCYVIASIMYLLGLKFSSRFNYNYWGKIAAVTGLVPHTAALVLRWYQTGHGPYSQLYEVTASNSWVAVFVFLFIQWRYKKAEQIGSLIMPVAFLLLGIGVMSSKEISTIPATFKTYWLVIHILFAKFAFGSTLAGTAFAVFYLLKGEKQTPWLDKLPERAKLDEFSYKFLSVGFLFNTIMIAAGSIWAKSAWGSYWSWDAIETWSLIVWLLYGVYLHLRRTFGWKGERAAWLAIALLFVMLFAIFGVVYIYPSIHEIYLKGNM